MTRYRALGAYLKESYGSRLGKICIDGGFTCPNRDGTCGVGGCIFCGERGAGEHIRPAPIAEQVRQGLTAGHYEKYIAYFQNFTNTYAPVDVLKRRYDEALTDPRIVVLAVGTRPDCIDEEVAKLLASYRPRTDVWVELGLQTASDDTARTINRGYPTSVYRKTADLLHRYDIPFVTHVMVGLPGEGMKEIKETSSLLAEVKPFGVKIHSIYVMRGTALATLYEKKLYTPPTMDFYLEATCYLLTHLPKDTVIHRLTGDCPAGMLLAPEWNADKNAVLLALSRKMETEQLTQGMFFDG